MIMIKTPRGTMRIHPDKFFPTTSADIKKLIKIVMEPWTGEGSDKLQEIAEYLEDRIKVLKDKSKHYDSLTRYETLTDPYDDLYESKRAELALRVCKNIDNDIKRLEKNLELVRQT